MQDTDKFGSLEILESSPYEQSNVHIKHDHEQRSRRRSKCMRETVNTIDQLTQSARPALKFQRTETNGKS